ncbi:MAG: pitrilysin family protein [Paracoccaceae bacterium]
MRRLLALAATMIALAAGPAAADWPVTTFTLDNGLEGVVIEDRRAPVATHMVFYRVGGADEPVGRSGLAHWLEHLMFKDADTAAEGGFSALVAANGGQDNAFTSPDVTAYFQRIASDRLGFVMGLEASRMRDLEVGEAEALTERDVILEERSQRVENDPSGRFGEQRTAAMYLNHPYGRPLIGWRHEIAQLRLADALAFHARHYGPDNAVLVVAGDVDPETVERLAREHYGDIPPIGAVPRERVAEPPHAAPRRVVYEDARVRQPYVIREFLAPTRRTEPERAAALEMLAAVLGDGLNARLQQALTVERELAVATGAWFSGSTRDYGEFAVYAAPQPGVSLDEIEAAMDEVLETFLASDGPSAEEMERVKTRWRASWIYSQDSQATLARRYGLGLAIGMTVEEIEAWPETLEAVTAEDVMEAARAVLRPETSVTGRLRSPEGVEG